MIRKLLVKSSPDGAKTHDVTETPGHLDPMNGWSEGVSVRKSYCSLLLKPQIVLRNRGEADETCVVVAVQAKLQSFAIMDDANADDPISGKVMTRSVQAVSGGNLSNIVIEHMLSCLACKLLHRHSNHLHDQTVCYCFSTPY